jgi:hypothetical protein
VITILGLQPVTRRPTGKTRGGGKNQTKKKGNGAKGAPGTSVEHTMEQDLRASQSQQLPANDADRLSVLTREEAILPPASGPQSTQNIMNAAEIPESDWHQIVRDNNILYGVVMGNKGVNEDNGPEIATYPLVSILKYV